MCRDSRDLICRVLVTSLFYPRFFVYKLQTKSCKSSLCLFLKWRCEKFWLPYWLQTLKIMYSRLWLLNSSKATNWYNHPCYDNITLTTFEGSEISRAESLPFAQSKNVAWTRKLVLEIASKVHYLVLFFSSQHKLFSLPEFFLLNAL